MAASSGTAMRWSAGGPEVKTSPSKFAQHSPLRGGEFRCTNSTCCSGWPCGLAAEAALEPKWATTTAARPSAGVSTAAGAGR